MGTFKIPPRLAPANASQRRRLSPRNLNVDEWLQQ
jgi:hypothetical protein